MAMFFGNEELIAENGRVLKPTKPQNLFVISLFSGLSGVCVVFVVTGGDENEKDDR